MLPLVLKERLNFGVQEDLLWSVIHFSFADRNKAIDFAGQWRN